MKPQATFGAELRTSPTRGKQAWACNFSTKGQLFWPRPIIILRRSHSIKNKMMDRRKKTNIRLKTRTCIVRLWKSKISLSIWMCGEGKWNSSKIKRSFTAYMTELGRKTRLWSKREMKPLEPCRRKTSSPNKNCTTWIPLAPNQSPVWWPSPSVLKTASAKTWKTSLSELLGRVKSSQRRSEMANSFWKPRGNSRISFFTHSSATLNSNICKETTQIIKFSMILGQRKNTRLRFWCSMTERFWMIKLKRWWGLRGWSRALRGPSRGF